MAGDWLKWGKGLARKPEILQISALLKIHPAQAAGHFMILAEWLDDTVSEVDADGNASVALGALQVSFLDGIAGIGGFAEALQSVRWLHCRGDALIFPKFARHNGQTAKARAVTNRRVSNFRERRNDCETQTTLPDALPEKNRKEEATLAPVPARASDSRKKPRKPDVVFEALAAVSGWNLDQLTDSARGALNKATKQIRAACPGADDAEISSEVRVRAGRYLTRGWGENSPLALAKHWPGLDGKRTERRENATRAELKAALPPEPEGWRDRMAVECPTHPLVTSGEVRTVRFADLPVPVRSVIADMVQKAS